MALEDLLIGGALGGLFIALGILALFIGIAVYIYTAFAWMKIARESKHKYPWLAWIPFANISMILQLGGFHWALVFLLLIPILGWLAVLVLFIISNWRIFEKRKYPAWLSLAPIIDIIPGLTGLGTLAYLVIIGLVAWKKP